MPLNTPLCYLMQAMNAAGVATCRFLVGPSSPGSSDSAAPKFFTGPLGQCHGWPDLAHGTLIDADDEVAKAAPLLIAA